jgi:hypothetical protein
MVDAQDPFFSSTADRRKEDADCEFQSFRKPATNGTCNLQDLIQALVLFVFAVFLPTCSAIKSQRWKACDLVP